MAELVRMITRSVWRRSLIEGSFSSCHLSRNRNTFNGHARQRNDLISCSEIGAVGAQSIILNTCITLHHSSQTGVHFSSVQFICCEQHFRSNRIPVRTPSAVTSRVKTHYFQQAFQQAYLPRYFISFYFAQNHAFTIAAIINSNDSHWAGQ